MVMIMNVEQLIEELLKVKDKLKKVYDFIDIDWVELEILDVVEIDDRVILGDKVSIKEYLKERK